MVSGDSDDDDNTKKIMADNQGIFSAMA